jgi:hypothetical protein
MEKSVFFESIGENIDRLITVDVRQRLPLIYPPMYKALRDKFKRPLTLLAAEKLKELVKPCDTVMVATGFHIPIWLAKGELDGPLGAASLARAINLGLEAKTLILSEKSILDVLKVACTAAEIKVFEGDVARTLPRKVPSTVIEEFPTDKEQAKEYANKLLDDINPSAVLCVEKVGPNKKGVYHSVYGSDVSEYAAKVDYLVEEANRRKILTIGIGDRGNEIGLGVIKDIVEKVIPTGSKCKCPCGAGIACVTETTVPVLAAVSNFGAYGITACLSALLDKPWIMQTPEVELQTVKECLEAGCVDALGWPTYSVDGIPLDVYVQIVNIMRHITTLVFTKYTALRP